MRQCLVAHDCMLVPADTCREPKYMLSTHVSTLDNVCAAAKYSFLRFI